MEGIDRVCSPDVHEREGGGNGVGEAIINEAVKILKEGDVKVLWCDAREVAWGFYERCGFAFASNEEGYECDAYTVPNIGLHKMMYRRL